MTTTATRAIKRLGLSLAAGLGPKLRSSDARTFLCERVVPYLLSGTVQTSLSSERYLPATQVRVPCDPHDPEQRMGFFCGVAQDPALEAFLLRELHAGDSFLDVGMAAGHVSLPAARLVGATGRVIAFEVRPRLAERVEALAKQQGLSALKVHLCGLDDLEGELLLQSGERSALRIGDEVLRKHVLPGRVGLRFSPLVLSPALLRGLRETIRDRVDYILPALRPAQLERSLLCTLFATLEDLGFQARLLENDGSTQRELSVGDLQAQTKLAFWRIAPRGRPRRFRPLTFRPVPVA